MSWLFGLTEAVVRRERFRNASRVQAGLVGRSMHFPRAGVFRELPDACFVFFFFLETREGGKQENS